MRRKSTVVCLILVSSFLTYSNQMKNEEYNQPRNKEYILPGKIAVRNVMEDKYLIYMDSDVVYSSFKLKNNSDVQFSSFIWLNTKDAFIGMEVINRLNRYKHRSNIAEFDLGGKLTERIYLSEEGEIAWPLYPSRDDKYLLFTTHRVVDPIKQPFEGLTPMLSLKIMDRGSKKVIVSIDSIGRSPNFQIKESPWLYNGYRFVYSINENTKLESVGIIINSIEADSAGVYIFDMASGKSNLIVPGGSSPIASPSSNKIAYKGDNSISILDLDTNKDVVLYQCSLKENLQGMHWTPDGSYIYFTIEHIWGTSNSSRREEKLIEVSSGNEVEFKRIGQGFGIYTWK